jgi:hypothetical protein
VAYVLGAAERRRTVDYMKRKARSARLQAARAAPVVADQLKALAMLIDAEAEKLANGELAYEKAEAQLEPV